MKFATAVMLGVVLLTAKGQAQDALCFDQTKTYGGLSFQGVRAECEDDPEIKGRPVPVMKCIFKTGELALDPQETRVDFDILYSLIGEFATAEKASFIKDQLTVCKEKVNSDKTAVEPFFKCLADEVVEKCKDFEGQIRRD